MATRESTNTKLAVIQNDIGYIKDRLNSVDSKLSSNYVTNDEFEPIKRIVYGLVALILIAVAGAVISTVIKS